MNILAYALLSMSRRWQKQLALIAIYTLVVTFYASVVLFTSSLQMETQAVLKDVPELWIQKIAGGRLQPMPVSVMDSMKNIRGIKEVVPRTWGYLFDGASGAVFTVMGSDSLITGLDMVKSLKKGSTKLDSNEVLVGTGILEMRGIEVGDYLSISETEDSIASFHVVGAFTAASDLLTRDLIILAPNAARKLIGLKPDEITDLALRIHNSDETDNIGRKIDRRMPGVRVVTKAQLSATYETLFSWRGGIFVYGAMLSVFAFLILAWERAAGLNNEEKKELGILKGIGWQIKDVLLLKSYEGLVISLTATLSGILLAYLHVFVFEAPLLRPFLVGWSVLYPSFHLQPVMDAGSVLMIGCLSVIPYLTATLIPAWRGAVTDPAEVMQG